MLYTMKYIQEIIHDDGDDVAEHQIGRQSRMCFLSLSLLMK